MAAVLRWLKRPARGEVLRPGDERFIHGAQALHSREGLAAARSAVALLVLCVGSALAWAALTQVDQVTRAEANVVPDGREQVVSHLEGGILEALLVREGALVQAGQPLLQLDRKRFEAQRDEARLKELALQAAIARAEAEAGGREIQFPPVLDGMPQLTQPERDAYAARSRTLAEAVAGSGRGTALLQRELDMAEAMAHKGLLSDVEVLRLRRQVNELRSGASERVHRARQDAAAELVRLRTELAALQEQAVLRDDALARTVVRSPVQGVVKDIRIGTRGSVVGPGAPILQIVPVGGRVLVEARVKPGDVGFVRVGQKAHIKLATYDWQTYGALTGEVEMLSPDTLRDNERSHGAEGPTYRALLRTDQATLQAGGQSLPVIPGMTATVEIQAGRRPVLAVLLQPVLKLREAFSER